MTSSNDLRRRDRHARPRRVPRARRRLRCVRSPAGSGTRRRGTSRRRLRVACLRPDDQCELTLGGTRAARSAGSASPQSCVDKALGGRPLPQHEGKASADQRIEGRLQAGRADGVLAGPRGQVAGDPFGVVTVGSIPSDHEQSGGVLRHHAGCRGRRLVGDGEGLRNQRSRIVSDEIVGGGAIDVMMPFGGGEPSFGSLQECRVPIE